MIISNWKRVIIGGWGFCWFFPFPVVRFTWGSVWRFSWPRTSWSSGRVSSRAWGFRRASFLLFRCGSGSTSTALWSRFFRCSFGTSLGKCLRRRSSSPPWGSSLTLLSTTNWPPVGAWRPPALTPTCLNIYEIVTYFEWLLLNRVL